MKRLLFIMITATLFLYVGCKQESKTNAGIDVEKREVTANNNTDKQGTLLFFMNPYGMPCQVQDRILSSISNEISEKLNIRYIKTTIPEDRKSFYDYTIRGLPSLIIVDNDLNETKRFTPGIIQGDEILKAIKEL